MNDKALAIEAEAEKERKLREIHFGEENYLKHEWIARIAKEVGKASAAALDYDEKEYRQELIQLISLATSAIECMERQRKVRAGILENRQ